MKHYDVLIVDDEEHSAAMLANRLELRGFATAGHLSVGRTRR